MMGLPLFLAHGALGAWDEIIFIGVAVIFLAMMGISWVRSRTADVPDDTPEAAPTPPTDAPNENEPDRFRLE